MSVQVGLQVFLASGAMDLSSAQRQRELRPAWRGCLSKPKNTGAVQIVERYWEQVKKKHKMNIKKNMVNWPLDFKNLQTNGQCTHEK